MPDLICSLARAIILAGGVIGGIAAAAAGMIGSVYLGIAAVGGIAASGSAGAFVHTYCQDHGSS